MMQKNNISNKIEYTYKAKILLTICIMLAAIMEIIDSTIANVSLPYIQSSLSATQDQISWVLTSYIVSAAVAMPMTGFLVSFIGTRNILILSVTGFTISSMFCGLAVSLEQMVLCRLLQGVFGAALVPLSQSILFDINPPEKHGQAMAVWGMGIMAAPICGPLLGGYITEYYNWRWIFFINLPIGILTAFGFYSLMPSSFDKKNVNFDIKGFLLFSTFIITLQLFLDRGEQKEWLESKEITAYLITFIMSLMSFIYYSFKNKNNKNLLIPIEIFQDKNYLITSFVMFILGMILMSSVAIMPQFVQILLGYNIIDSGILSMPRGFGVMISMAAIGKNMNKLNIKIVVFVGLMFVSLSLYCMTQFTLSVSETRIAFIGFIQGIGFGLIFVPLSTIAFGTLPGHLRTQASALFSLIRNIGGSIGISVAIFLITYLTKLNYATMTESVVNNSKTLLDYTKFLSISEIETFGLISNQIFQQSALIGYLSTFKFLMIIAIIAMPCVLLIKNIKRNNNSNNVDLH